MTIVTQEQDIRRGAEVFDTLHEAIIDLRREIEDLAQEAKADDTINDKAAKDSLSRIKELVFQCIKAENYLNDCRSKQAGIAKGGYALDLDRARVDIGCKLDRLRRCGRPRAVSE